MRWRKLKAWKMRGEWTTDRAKWKGPDARPATAKDSY